MILSLFKGFTGLVQLFLREIAGPFFRLVVRCTGRRRRPIQHSYLRDAGGRHLGMGGGQNEDPPLLLVALESFDCDLDGLA